MQHIFWDRYPNKEQTFIRETVPGRLAADRLQLIVPFQIRILCRGPLETWEPQPFGRRSRAWYSPKIRPAAMQQHAFKVHISSPDAPQQHG